MNKHIILIFVAICVFAAVASARPALETEELIENEALRFRRSPQYYGNPGRRHGHNNRHNGYHGGNGPYNNGGFGGGQYNNGGFGGGHNNNGFGGGHNNGGFGGGGQYNRNPYGGNAYNNPAVYPGYNQGQSQSNAQSTANAQSFNGQIGLGPLQAQFSGSQASASASAGGQSGNSVYGR